MTQDRKLKNEIHARMRWTGELYVVAKLKILADRKEREELRKLDADAED